jgi:hypothetical protein
VTRVLPHMEECGYTRQEVGERHIGELVMAAEFAALLRQSASTGAVTRDLRAVTSVLSPRAEQPTPPPARTPPPLSYMRRNI